MSPSFVHTYPIEPRKAVVVLKRAIDILGGSLGMAFFLITFPIIALAIKIDSKGPAIYKQTRTGKNRRKMDRRSNNPSKILVIKNKRRPGSDRRKKDACGVLFTLFKYRTMEVNAEEAGPRLCLDGVNDPRVTRVGSWLRFLHLDELPQFWNVIKGDMSLIGPRPERPHFTEIYIQKIPYYLERTRFVKPGLTGLAQITLGYDKSLQTVTHKYYYDLTYRIAMSSFTSWLRMESWILINTVKYLWNQIRVSQAFKHLFMWRRFNLLRTETPLVLDAESPIHISHPWKLIERINTHQKRTGRKIPDFIDEFSTTGNIAY